MLLYCGWPEWSPRTDDVICYYTISDHSINPNEVVILDREQDWFRRGIREALDERIERPSLNKRGGLRFHLSSTWDWALGGLPRCMSANHNRYLPVEVRVIRTESRISCKPPKTIQYMTQFVENIALLGLLDFN